MRSIYCRHLNLVTLDASVTVEDAFRYDTTNFDTVTCIHVASKAGLSNLKSATSDQVGVAWVTERERLEQGDMSVTTRGAPGCLAVSESLPAFVIVEDMVAIARRIFALASVGLRKRLIARTPKLEKMPRFGTCRRMALALHREDTSYSERR